MRREVDIAWCAGLIDGEGSIKIYNGRVWFRVVMTDLAPLQQLLRVLGGTIHDHQFRPPRKMAWCWMCRARDLRANLVALLPYLTVKAADARCALDHLASIAEDA